MSFKNELTRLVDNMIDEYYDEHIEDTAEVLKDSFRSSKAAASATKLNKLFEHHEVKDDDGNPIIVADPATIADNVSVEGDKFVFKLIDDQRRFISGDKLYGSDILSDLNIKYTER